jgi:hypothetical protein
MNTNKSFTKLHTAFITIIRRRKPQAVRVVNRVTYDGMWIGETVRTSPRIKLTDREMDRALFRSYAELA